MNSWEGFVANNALLPSVSVTLTFILTITKGVVKVVSTCVKYVDGLVLKFGSLCY